MTAAEAAVALRVTTQTISNWETNRFRPHISKSAEIEDLYGLERGMVAALLQGDRPPADLVEPTAVGIQNGRLRWSARRVLTEDGRAVDWPENLALQEMHEPFFVAASAIRDEPGLQPSQKEILLRLLESFHVENVTKGIEKPRPEPEAEGA